MFHTCNVYDRTLTRSIAGPDVDQVKDELVCLGACTADPKLKDARGFMYDYRSKSMASLKAFVTDGPDRVAWSPSCFDHCANLCMNTNNAPASVNGVTYANGLASWFFNGTYSGTALVEECPPGQLLCTPHCGGGCQDC